ncbi:MAG TPA: YhjD/YihY/BrkB family envelope integrity protein, partial [Vicinamibacterales bacterium]|nr:YhjD/YihY/BrkB family envelope integrity protein [Vicinamibacterales bacterium]
YYVVNISSYAATYGALGGVMVLMLWFYLSGAVILFGAEMNAEIEHASPHGKQPGEKVPGERRVIGSAAMRAWLDKRRGRGGHPPSADEVRKITEHEPAAAMAASPRIASQGKGTGRGVDWLLAITVAITQFWMTLRALRKTRA